MKVLLLADANVSGYYTASLLERGHNVIAHGGGAPIFNNPSELVAVRKKYLSECDGCLLIGNDPELLEIAGYFEDTGKPLWYNLAEVPK